MIGTIDILPVILLVIIIVYVRISKPVGTISPEECLSKDQTKQLRGLFALIVMLHHLAQKITSGMLFPFFTMMGTLAVAVFYFLSGYGLQKSYLEKSEKYREKFIQKRFCTLLIPYIIITLIYWLAFYCFGNHYTLHDVLNGFTNGEPIVSYSWFIISLFSFYLVYWVLMRVCRTHYLRMILFGFIWYCVYVVLCIKLGYGARWYNAFYLLIVGMTWAIYEDKIHEVIRRKYYVIAPAVWIAFIGLFICHHFVLSIQEQRFAVLLCCTVAESFLFVAGIILLLVKIHLNNPVLSFLGNISLEIYLFHGLFIEMTNTVVVFRSELLRCIAVIALTIIIAFCFHAVVKTVLGRNKNIKESAA